MIENPSFPRTRSPFDLAADLSLRAVDRCLPCREFPACPDVHDRIERALFASEARERGAERSHFEECPGCRCELDRLLSFFGWCRSRWGYHTIAGLR